MLEVTDKSLRARRSVPCCRGRDGPDQSAASTAGPAFARLAGLFPTTLAGVSFLLLEEVHRPKPWLNYPAAAAKAMRPLARANRECTDCRICFSFSFPLPSLFSHSFSFSSSRCLLVSLSTSLSLSSLAHSFFYVSRSSPLLFPSFLSFFSISILYKSLSVFAAYVALFLHNASSSWKISIPASRFVPWPLSLL